MHITSRKGLRYIKAGFDTFNLVAKASLDQEKDNQDIKKTKKQKSYSKNFKPKPVIKRRRLR